MLTKEHLEELQNSKIDLNIAELNFKTVAEEEAFEHLLFALGGSERRNDGRLRDKWLRQYAHLNAGGWWATGGIDLITLGLKDWGVLKPNSPRADQKGKPIKYETPPGGGLDLFVPLGGGSFSNKQKSSIRDFVAFSPEILTQSIEYWEKVIKDPGVPVFLAEGAKKTASLFSLGVAAVGVAGVNCGYTVLPDGTKQLDKELQVLATPGREVVIAFDQDKRFTTRNAVAKAIETYSTLFKECGCSVFILSWDSSLGKGIDDFLSNGNQLNDAIKSIYPEWRQKQAKPPLKLNLAQLLDFVESELASDLAFDTLHNQVTYKGEVLAFEETIRIWFLQTFGYQANKEDLCEVLLFFAKKQEYSPIKKYLEAVAVNKGIAIDNLSSRYLGTTDPLYDLLVKKWLISAVARVFIPGCQVDHVLILQGAQGIYKSSFFRVLGGEWFDSSATNRLQDKDNKLIIHSSWIEEFAEFEQFSKKEQGEIKQWFTCTHDNFRKPYGRVSETHPRAVVFCATCNKDDFLKDETGSRRFWVVPINPSRLDEGKINLAQLKKERDLIWAGAVQAFLQGESWWVDTAQEKLVSEANLQFKESDDWEIPIFKFLGETVNEVTVNEILLKALLLEDAKQDRCAQTRVGKILKTAGWTVVQKRINGVRTRVYVRPFRGESLSQPPLSEVVTPSNPAIVKSLANSSSCGESLSQPPLSEVVTPSKPTIVEVSANCHNLSQPKRDFLKGEIREVPKKCLYQLLRPGDLIGITPEAPRLLGAFLDKQVDLRINEESFFITYEIVEGGSKASILSDGIFFLTKPLEWLSVVRVLWNGRIVDGLVNAINVKGEEVRVALTSEKQKKDIWINPNYVFNVLTKKDL